MRTERQNKQKNLYHKTKCLPKTQEGASADMPLVLNLTNHLPPFK